MTSECGEDNAIRGHIYDLVWATAGQLEVKPTCSCGWMGTSVDGLLEGGRLAAREWFEHATTAPLRSQRLSPDKLGPYIPGTGRNTHPYAGTSKARQEVGLAGHCDDCARVGHVITHPDLGCGDVECGKGHGPDDPEDL